MSEPLEPYECVHINTILRDCLDQLSILSNIASVSAETKADALKRVKAEIADIIIQQGNLEQKYQDIWQKRLELDGQIGIKEQLLKVTNDVKNAALDLRANTTHMGIFLRQNPLGSDMASKIQFERAYLTDVLKMLSVEIQEHGTFDSLNMASQHEKEKKEKLKPLIEKEFQQRHQIKALQKQIAQIKKDKQKEIEERCEIIAHYKDQLQEIKAKAGMEQKYEQKFNDMKLGETEKRCKLTIKELQTEIDNYHKQIDEETRVNSEICNYLTEQGSILSEKLEQWSKQYESDVESKERQLKLLKASRDKDYDRFNELSKLYTEYEAVVLEDKREKEEARRKREKEERELSAALLIQVWWRYIMQKKKLGPYGKKKKGKKGKKGKKKGKAK